MSETDDLSGQPLVAENEEEAEVLRELRRKRLCRREGGVEGDDTATSPTRSRSEADPGPASGGQASGHRSAPGGVVAPMGPPLPAGRHPRRGSSASAGSSFAPARTPRAATPSSASDATPSPSQRNDGDARFRIECVERIKHYEARGDEARVTYWEEQLQEHTKSTVRTRGPECSTRRRAASHVLVQTWLHMLTCWLRAHAVVRPHARSCGFHCLLQAAQVRVDAAVAASAKGGKRAGEELTVFGASMPFLVRTQLCLTTAATLRRCFEALCLMIAVRCKRTVLVCSSLATTVHCRGLSMDGAPYWHQ